MKKYIIGLIVGLVLGFALTLPFQATAQNGMTWWQIEVLDLLKQIERHGDDISSDTETLINAVSNLPRG